MKLTTLLASFNHHEKLNGKGYPIGLSEDNLTLEDRILSVADIFSALTEKRYYRDSLPKSEVLSILNDCVTRNELGPDIINITSSNYDKILKSVQVELSEFNDKFEKIDNEYKKLSAQI